jgi:putative methylase
MKKRELISIIQHTKPFNNPKIKLEQYCIDAMSAVDILFFAGFEHDDIKNRIVIDLGAGTGRLSIVALYLQALIVLSVDIDQSALSILKNNCEELDLYHLIHPINSDIIQLPFLRERIRNAPNITTIMNPPFGVQTKKADRIFLDKAFEYSDVIYSIHLSNDDNREFLYTYFERKQWIVDDIFTFNMILQKTFEFHTQKRKKVLVDLYRIVKRD